MLRFAQHDKRCFGCSLLTRKERQASGGETQKLIPPFGRNDKQTENDLAN
jgi:hypothetical protein